MEQWKKKTILFLTSQAVSLFGSSVVAFAIVWYVTKETDSGLWISLLTASSYLPQFIVSLFAGVWADRYSKKKLIILADSVIALVTLLLVLFLPHFKTMGAMLLSLVVIAVLRSIGTGIQTPAEGAVIPEIVPEDKLMKVNGYNSAISSAVQFVSPAAAGFFLSFLSLRATLLIDIVTAVIGIGILSFLTIEPTNSSEPECTMLEDLKSGLLYVRSRKLIQNLLLTYGFYIFLGVPAGFLCSLYVTRYFTASYLHLTAVELVGFGGMTIGGLLMTTRLGKHNHVKTYTWGVLLFGIFSILLALPTHFVGYLILMFIFGIIMTAVQTSSTTVLQETTAPDMLGRVFGLFATMFSLFLPVGMMIFGPLADYVSLKLLMMIAGGLILLLGFLAGRMESVQSDASSNPE